MLCTSDLSRDVRGKVSPERESRRRPRRLILGRLPVRRDLAGAGRPGVGAAREAELAAVRAALAEPRSAGDRALDRVVDKLLEELTW